MEPFLRAPKLVVAFQQAATGQRFRLPIPLPVPMSRFVAAVQFTKEQFNARWQDAKCARNEVKATWKAQHGISSALALDAIKQRFARLNLAPIDAVCATAGNGNVRAAGAGKLCTGTLLGGKPVVIGILVLLETAPAARSLRVTVRAVHKSCSEVVAKLFSRMAFAT